MQSVLHRLVIDRARGAALASRVGSLWLLPMLRCSERARPAPAIGVWTAQHGIVADFAGQWLGRLARSRDSIDWLAVLDVTGHATAPPQLSWVPLADLVSSLSVVDYQSWAVGVSLQRGPLPSVGGPFGNLSWLDEVKRWIAGAVDEARLGTITPYRVTPHEVVLGADTGGGRVYFKGLMGERGAEARLTMALNSRFPGSFARTLAIEEKADGPVWWLSEECSGAPLPKGDAGAAHHAACALAAMQQAIASEPQLLADLPSLSLPSVVEWAASLTGEPAVREGLQPACELLDRGDATWIPLDLHPTNVLVSPDRTEVRFIDLDESFAGPAPLAIATLARRLGDRSLYTSYERTWGGRLRNVSWPSVERVAAVVDAWLGWTRVTRHTERGETFGVLDLANKRLAERLVTMIKAP